MISSSVTLCRKSKIDATQRRQHSSTWCCSLSHHYTQLFEGKRAVSHHYISKIRGLSNMNTELVSTVRSTSPMQTEPRILPELELLQSPFLPPVLLPSLLRCHLLQSLMALNSLPDLQSLPGSCLPPFSLLKLLLHLLAGPVSCHLQ